MNPLTYPSLLVHSSMIHLPYIQLWSPMFHQDHREQPHRMLQHLDGEALTVSVPLARSL